MPECSPATRALTNFLLGRSYPGSTFAQIATRAVRKWKRRLSAFRWTAIDSAQKRCLATHSIPSGMTIYLSGYECLLLRSHNYSFHSFFLFGNRLNLSIWHFCDSPYLTLARTTLPLIVLSQSSASDRATATFDCTVLRTKFSHCRPSSSTPPMRYAFSIHLSERQKY